MKQKKKMEVFDILKEAVSIYVTNINFIIFTFLTSIPFFCVMVYFEFIFQATLVKTPEIIEFLPFYERYDSIDDDIIMFPLVDYLTTKSFSKDYLPVLIQLVFIYLVPLHVLELCSAALTMDLTSKVRSEENKISLKQMFQKPFDISIIKGTFMTSLYKLFLSASFILAFPWTVSNFYCLYKTFGGRIFFGVICFLALVKLLKIYLERSAIWNMSIVVSVLDGIYGSGAFRVSYFFSGDNQKRGFHLMLVFFALGLCLRLSCISLGCYKGGYGIYAQIGLLSVLNTFKWVACTIYFDDCKERKLEKKVDAKLGPQSNS